MTKLLDIFEKLKQNITISTKYDVNCEANTDMIVIQNKKKERSRTSSGYCADDVFDYQFSFHLSYNTCFLMQNIKLELILFDNYHKHVPIHTQNITLRDVNTYDILSYLENTLHNLKHKAITNPIRYLAYNEQHCADCKCSLHSQPTYRYC